MRRRSLALTLAALALPSGVGACRAVAGINGDLTYAPGSADGGGNDARRDARPDARDAGSDAADAPTADATRGDARGDARADAREDAKLDAGPDVQFPDANACPGAAPVAMFEVGDGGLGPIILGDASLYAEVVYGENGPFRTNAPYSGLIECAKRGCARPRTVADYTGQKAKVQWGGAAEGPGGLYTALSSFSQVGVDDAGDDSGYPQEAGSISVQADDGDASVVRGGLAHPFLMTATTDTLYWVDDPEWMDGNVFGSWRVLSCALPSCATVSVVMEGTPTITFGLYLDAANVYVVALNSDGEASTLFGCSRTLGCADGPTVILSALQPATGFYAWPSDPLLGGDTFASDGTSLYRADQTNYYVRRVVPGAPSDPILASPNDLITSIAVDDTYVYWAVQQSGTIQRVRKDNAWQGNPQNVVCSGGAIANIAVDDKNIYFETVQATNGPKTAFWRAPLPSP